MEGHIIVAFMEHYGMVSLDDTPTAIMETLEKAVNKQAKFQELILEVIKSHIQLPIRPTSSKKAAGDDGVLAYAEEVLTMTFLWAEFEDAIKEGDGNRVLRCWKFSF